MRPYKIENIQEIYKQEAINKTLAAIQPEWVESVFLTGTQPEILLPQTDLDIITIAKEEHLENILDSYVTAMKDLPESATYSLINGPDKREYQGLVHLIVWTNDMTATDTSSLYTQPKPILDTLRNNYTMLVGRDLNKLLNDMPSATDDEIRERIKRMRKHTQTIHKTTNHGRWHKIHNMWKYERIIQKTNTFEQKYLKEYYEKFIQLYEERLS